MPKGRRTASDIIEIKKFIASLILNRSSEIVDSNNKPSPLKITGICEKELGKTINEHTIAKYLRAPDLITYQHIAPPEENERMRDLDKRIILAKHISENATIKPKERIMALNSYKGLFNEKSKYEKQLADERVKIKEVSRPVHLIKYGQLESVKKVCPKCKHEFYDVKGSGGVSEGVNEKRNNFKAENGQATLEPAEKDTQTKDV